GSGTRPPPPPPPAPRRPPEAGEQGRGDPVPPCSSAPLLPCLRPSPSCQPVLHPVLEARRAEAGRQGGVEPGRRRKEAEGGREAELADRRQAEGGRGAAPQRLT